MKYENILKYKKIIKYIKYITYYILILYSMFTFYFNVRIIKPYIGDVNLTSLFIADILILIIIFIIFYIRTEKEICEMEILLDLKKNVLKREDVKNDKVELKGGKIDLEKWD